MNFNMGNSGGGRQGFYNEEEQQQGKHLHHQHQHQYPCSNSSSSSPNYEQHQHQHQHQHQRGTGNWLDSRGGGGGEGGGGPNSQLEISVMDMSPAHDDESSSQAGMSMRGGSGQGQQQQVPVVEIEREHMFDKVVTPSDVGKLNRLVIPKQHAERYFPLDSSTNEKGLLLNFEDRNGKPWRFRYSYWNSSQSYVMTKGWSRFVKEKKLDAGDIVSFQRGVGDLGKDRLFIDWRRRPDAPPHHPQVLAANLSTYTFPHHHLNFSFQRSSSSSSVIHPHQHQPWNPIFLQTQRGGGGGGYGLGLGLGHSHLPQSSSYGGPAAGPPNYGYNTMATSGTPCSGSVIYFRSAPQQQLGMQSFQIQQQRGISGIDQYYNPQVQVQSQPPPPPPPVVFESVPVVHGKAAAKRLRLFGVNMDCPINSPADSQELPLPFSTTTTTTTNDPYHHQYYNTTTCSSSSSSTIPYLQLTPNYSPTSGTPSCSSDKAKASMSLDLDI